MRISVDVSGYYDWAPCPPGTEISQADVSALRVKKMSDDKWHMRVIVACPDDAPNHHDVGIHEETICQRMASLEKIGRRESREQVIAGILQTSFKHHLSPTHMLKINVMDDGPNEELLRSELAKLEVTDAEDLVADYVDSPVEDTENYLNVFFKTKSTKKPSAPKASAKKGSK